MSQTALAKQLGVTASAVSKWEKVPDSDGMRSSEPSARVLWKMICLYRLNPDWLFEGTGTPQLSIPPGTKNSPEAQSVVQLSFQTHPLSIPLDRINEVGEEVKSIHAAIENLRLKLNAD